MTPVIREEVSSALCHVLHYSARLPLSGHAEGVQRSLVQLIDATGRGTGIEDATSRLVIALRHLDGRHRGGKRREFQRSVPALGLVLETLQEELLPALRRAGFLV